jgi:hypothetical protein
VIRAAEWYVGSQVKIAKPFWDANFGRFIYTYHMPTKRAVLGISWTQARAIMVLLGAYELTGEQRYLAAARLGGEYIRNLQVLDPRDPRCYGAIREEVPTSWYVNVRDSAEAACGLMHLYRITKHEEYLYRARLWANWFLANCLDESGWPIGKLYLYENKPAGEARFYQAGGAHVFYYLHNATGWSTYVERGLLPLVDGLLERFVRDDGAIITTSDDAHHGTRQAREAGVAVNDDGAGTAMLVGYAATKRQRYLDAAVRYGRYLVKQDIPELWAALGGRMIFLYDLARVARDKQFSQWADARVEELLTRQQLETDDPLARGGFIGEDEPPQWYCGGKGDQYVVNRATAYSALALMRCHGQITGPYYGADRWDVAVEAPARDPALCALIPE